MARPEEQTLSSPQAYALKSAQRQFLLVVIMLFTLFLLALALILIPFFAHSVAESEKLADYCKWTMAVLLGAFGAWIGAGAAYFFGKENLAESSRSTEEALRIQMSGLRPQVRRIRDLPLSPLNRDFVFTPDSTRKDVLDKLDLEKYRGYWWVPVLDKDAKVVDIIHARVFWADPGTNGFDPATKITDIRAKLDTDVKCADLKPLHGSSFFTRVALTDEVKETQAIMDQSGAVVGIVEDDKGKVTFCFTKQDMVSAESAWEGSALVAAH